MIVSAVQAAAAAAEQKSAQSDTSSLLAMDDDKGTVPVNLIISLAISLTLFSAIFLQCFDAVGWAAGRASDLCNGCKATVALCYCAPSFALYFHSDSIPGKSVIHTFAVAAFVYLLSMGHMAVFCI